MGTRKPKPQDQRKNKKAMTAENPRAAGRPTHYRPEMCQQLIDLMAQGYSKTAAAYLMGTTIWKLNDYEEKHPELKEASDFAKGARTYYHEHQLMHGDTERKVGHIFALKNAAPHEWRDRHEVTGAEGGAIKIEHSMDPLEIARRMAFMLAQGQQALDTMQVIEHQPLEKPDED